jgi:transcriptional regulator with XRE-family HTH domain
MSAEAFEAALAELGWKGADFCRRTGLVPNTVWRWRKGLGAVPPWAGEYLRALLALQRLHGEFVAVKRPSDAAGLADDADPPPPGGAAAADAIGSESPTV